MNYLKSNLNSKKVAYVVGGLGSIGLEVSKALSDSGAKVLIIDVKKLDKKNELISGRFQGLNNDGRAIIKFKNKQEFISGGLIFLWN